MFSMAKKKLIIFDLDGTLINTVPDLNNAVNFAMRKFNFPERTILQTTNDIGNGVAILIARSIPNGMENPAYSKCLATFRQFYREHYFDKSLPYSSMSEVLGELKNRGYQLAVVSNKFDEGAKKLILHFFPNTFSLIQGEKMPLRTKPSPDMVEFVLSSLNIKKEDAIYVGDTEVDYQTASNSGIDCVLVSYGYRNKDQLLEKTKNAPIVDAPIDLLNIF